MRIGSTVLLYNGYCYNSYNWNFLRPLGKLNGILSSLDELKIDEILVLRPIKGVDTDLIWEIDINEIIKSYTTTPLIFGGGIRNINRLSQLKYLPIERIAFSSKIITHNYKKLKIIEKAILEFGKQAIISILPYKYNDDKIYLYNSEDKKYILMNNSLIKIINEYSNEILLYNISADGMYKLGEIDILSRGHFDPNSIIYTGGITDFTLKYLYKKHKDLAAIYIDNKTLFNEQHIYKIKKQVLNEKMY